MLLLFETPAGFALFTVLQENKLQEAEVGAGILHNLEHQAPEHAFSCLCVLQDLWSDFETLDDAHKVM